MTILFPQETFANIRRYYLIGFSPVGSHFWEGHKNSAIKESVRSKDPRRLIDVLSPQAPASEAPPPWKEEDNKREASQTVTHNITTRIVNSHSAPSQGLNTLAGAPRLPRAQNPTITLLQKARGKFPILLKPHTYRSAIKIYVCIETYANF